jgi:hypothetical protein
MHAVAILHDQTTDRYHAVYFNLAPFPGGGIEPKRWKSGGHHTDGTATQDEAVEYREKLRQQLGGELVEDLGIVEQETVGACILFS